MTEKINRCKSVMQKKGMPVNSNGTPRLIGYDYYGDIYRILNLSKNKKVYLWELQSRCKQFLKKNGNWKYPYN